MITVLTLLAAAVLPAQAQQAVRQCRVNGQVVFQHAPCAQAERPAAQAAVATPSAPSQKKTLADMLRARDANTPRHIEARDPAPDGAHVLQARMGAM